LLWGFGEGMGLSHSRVLTSLCTQTSTIFGGNCVQWLISPGITKGKKGPKNQVGASQLNCSVLKISAVQISNFPFIHTKEKQCKI